MTMRVGLVMIVRNEEAVVRRALLSALPFITTWLIVDTGSTDRTCDIIRETMAQLPGELVIRPWVNFGHNRTEALTLCDGRMDWAIMLDADDNLEGVPPPSTIWEKDDLDGIAIRIKHNDIWHHRVQIFRMGRNWVYEGVLHEFPVCKQTAQPIIGLLPQETYMVTRCEGVRSRNPRKYLDDAELLEIELARNPGDARTLFYLAQSYRDAGMASEAARYYAQYLDGSGGNIQERYIAILSLIGLTEIPATKLELAWRAVELCPQRVEAPFLVLQTWRQRGWPVTMQVWALARSVENRRPDLNWLFVNPSVYEWGIDNEISVAAFARGCYRECYEASMRCAVWAPNETMREAARRNARAAQERLTPYRTL
jgi:hypothetical protein